MSVRHYCLFFSLYKMSASLLLGIGFLVSWQAVRPAGARKERESKALRRNGSVIGSRSLCGTCSAVAQLTTLWRKFVDTLQVVHPSRVLVERVSWDSNGFQFHNFTPHLLEHQLRSPSQPAATYSLRSFPEQNRTYANLTLKINR